MNTNIFMGLLLITCAICVVIGLLFFGLGRGTGMYLDLFVAAVWAIGGWAFLRRQS